MSALAGPVGRTRFCSQFCRVFLILFVSMAICYLQMELGSAYVLD